VETQEKSGSVREGPGEGVVKGMVKRGGGQYGPVAVGPFSGVGWVQEKDWVE